jgi:hypothetical protein
MIIPNLNFDIVMIAKIFSLVIIGLYAVFVLIVFINVRSLTKLVLIKSSSGSQLITLLTFIYLVLTIFLFILALVIL